MTLQSYVPRDRWPRVVMGTFAALLGLFVLNAAWDLSIGRTLGMEFYVGAITSLPFIFVIGYAGHVLQTSGIAQHRHRRIVGWLFGGLLVFLAINLLMMLLFPPRPLPSYVGWARWAAALGGGVGVTIGLFEARAIDRELTAERERVRNQELTAQKNRLDEFANILSHDLRSPLNVASGNVELAADTHDIDRLDDALDALSRMDAIIDRTLDLARSGRVIGETELVDLTEVVDQCWQHVETGDATLVHDDLPTIEADPDRLQHLFENLFRNAVEHGSTNPRSHAHEDSVEHGSTDSRDAARLDDAIEHAGPTVTVTVGSQPGGFYVADDGPGIPESDRATVFDVGVTTIEGGTGFGLAIVREIADAHGWTVRVTESESGGARFEFTDVDQDT